MNWKNHSLIWNHWVESAVFKDFIWFSYENHKTVKTANFHMKIAGFHENRRISWKSPETEDHLPEIGNPYVFLFFLDGQEHRRTELHKYAQFLSKFSVWLSITFTMVPWYWKYLWDKFVFP